MNNLGKIKQTYEKLMQTSDKLRKSKSEPKNKKDVLYIEDDPILRTNLTDFSKDIFFIQKFLLKTTSIYLYQILCDLK